MERDIVALVGPWKEAVTVVVDAHLQGLRVLGRGSLDRSILGASWNQNGGGQRTILCE